MCNYLVREEAFVSEETESFEVLIARVRQGDPRAAEELIQQYERDLRVIARVRLTDPRLRRTMDSMDICQSILANFFVRVAAGQFELETPEQLMKLLATMVRNKVTDHARRSRRDCRDTRRDCVESIEEFPVASIEATPSQIVARRELVEALHQQLNDEQRTIARKRADGYGWQEIAGQLGRSAEAVRKGYSRAVDRAVMAIGIDGVRHD